MFVFPKNDPRLPILYHSKNEKSHASPVLQPKRRRMCDALKERRTVSVFVCSVPYTIAHAFTAIHCKVIQEVGNGSVPDRGYNIHSSPNMAYTL